MDLSVIIPLCNGAPWIEATLRALDAQTTRPREVIVVDDGSSDGGVHLVRDFRFRDGSSPQIVRHEASLGVAASRNHGAHVASGDWLGFCDQDDLWHPRRIERMAEVVAREPQRLAIATECFGFALESDRDALEPHLRSAMVNQWVPDDQVETLEQRVPAGVSSRYRELTFEDFQQGGGLPTTTVCFQRDLLTSVGGYPSWNNATGDWLLHAGIAAISPILVIDEPLVFYRVRPSSQSDNEARLARGALTVLLALRFGDRADRRPVGIVYHHMVRIGAASDFSLAETLGFALLGRFGLKEIVGLILPKEIAGFIRATFRR